MRVALQESSFRVVPSSTFEVVVEVFNDREVIDGLTTRVVGFPPEAVIAHPSELALFPQSLGTTRLVVSVPPAFPAGDHVVEVEVVSSVAGGGRAVETIHLDVAEHRAATLDVAPNQVAGRGRASFELIATNTGNVPQALELSASDPQGSVQFEFARPFLDLEPGQTISIPLSATARRRTFGGHLAIPFVVRAASSAETPLADGAADDDGGRVPPFEATGTFLHKAIISPGVMTAAMLAGIVALWALAMVFGLRAALGKDTATMVVPASFYASCQSCADGDGSASGSASGAEAVAASGAADRPPAGTLPKSGPAGAAGGSISGTVTVKSTGKGTGRVTVKVFHQERDGSKTTVGAAATSADGTYKVGGLLPGPYRVQLVGTGFLPMWVGGATAIGTADDVQVRALETTSGVDAVVEGAAGAIVGTVDTGLAGLETSAAAAEVTIELKATDLAEEFEPQKQVKSGGGPFDITGLPTPATYTVTVSSPSYLPSAIPVRVGAGQRVDLSTIRLTAANGTLAGTVEEGGKPLGGVLVTATSGDLTFKTATPTIGAVGQFAFPTLPTPGSYLLTFTKEGYGTKTTNVALGPGGRNTQISIDVSRGSGTVSGRVTNAEGDGIGDATITIQGGENSVVTQSLTSGSDKGSYTVSGLPAPARYTATIAAEGYVTQTIPILASDGVAGGQDVVLARATGTLKGNVYPAVVGALCNVAQAEVVVTNGVFTASTIGITGPPVSYSLPGLPAGNYTATFAAPGCVQQSWGVVIRADGVTKQNATLEAED